MYNKNEYAKTDVKFYVRGITDTSKIERRGKYLLIMNYKGIEKEIYKTMTHATPCKMIINGITDGIKILKMPCNIKLYTHTPIGLESYFKNGTGVNKRLVQILFENLYMGNHSLEEFICKDRQGELKEKMKNI